MVKELSYSDAVKLLGGPDSRLVSALDRLTGGLLLAATAGGSTFALSLFEAKGELARLSGELISGLGERMRGLGRFDRSERLAAAHKVIVLTGYFEAVSSIRLPIGARELALTSSTQVGLATGQNVLTGRLRELAGILNESAVPGESTRLAEKPGAATLQDFYGSVSHRLLLYLEDIPAWSALSGSVREDFRLTLQQAVPESAVRHYETLLRRLATEFPEVAFWTNRLDHAALGDGLRALSVGLTDMGRVLDEIASGRVPDERREGLIRRYRKALDRPIMEVVDIPDGLTIPSLVDIYINPWFRAARVTRSAAIDRESWWDEYPAREDLQEFLVTYLTSVRAADCPLIVLGQPGSGKSVLTKILSARLPPTDYLVVRVALREVPADTDLQSQIEHAIRAETGENLAWPALARAAGDAMPVILLDGFDELLQATGIGQTDYLEQVARFQEREADQGRPVAVIVTSRTAVADRARIPLSGAMVVKLEPFTDAQVRHWLTVWNTANAAYLAHRGARQLTAEVVLRQRALSGQPLLLMMLALYDAADNALQKDEAGLDEADLYERLLVSFVEREVQRTGRALTADPLHIAVERELLRLSVTAFSMFNRGRQWATENELSADLTALLGSTDPPRPTTGFHEPSTPAQIVVSRFFFIHQAQAMRDDRRVTTCEFLHATFGEYLIARLITRELTDMRRLTTLTTSRTRQPTSDGFLRVLLSYAPLTMRAQVVEFLTTLVHRLPEPDAAQLRRLLLAAFHTSLEPSTDRTHEDYRPTRLTAPALHAAYSANLLLLLALIGGPVTGRELFPHLPFTVPAWRGQALLWRSQFNVEGWHSLTTALHLKRFWVAGDREIAISSTPWPPGRLEGFWLYRIPPEDDRRQHSLGWVGGRLEDLRRESYFTCDYAEDVAWHALEPITEELDAEILRVDPSAYEATSAFGRVNEDAAVSVTHAMIRLWLASSRPTGTEDLEQEYENCLEVIKWSRPGEDSTSRDAYHARVLRQMAADRHRLSDKFLTSARHRFQKSILEPAFLDNHPQAKRWALEAFPGLDDTNLGQTVDP